VAMFSNELPDNTTCRIVVLNITHPCTLRGIREARLLKGNVLKKVCHDLCATEDFRARRFLVHQFLVLVKVFVKLQIIGDARIR